MIPGLDIPDSVFDCRVPPKVPGYTRRISAVEKATRAVILELAAQKVPVREIAQRFWRTDDSIRETLRKVRRQ